MVVIVGSLVVVVRELDVRVVVVDEGEIGVDEGQCVEHGKDSFSVPRLRYSVFQRTFVLPMVTSHISTYIETFL